MQTEQQAKLATHFAADTALVAEISATVGPVPRIFVKRKRGKVNRVDIVWYNQLTGQTEKGE